MPAADRSTEQHLLQIELARGGVRCDEGETAHVDKALERVKARTYDKKYPTLKAKQFIPVSPDTDPNDETIVYQQWDEYAMAKIITHYADDLPLSDVAVKEFRVPVKSLGAAHQYSIQDMRRASKTGSQLPQRRSNAAKGAIERRTDHIAAHGDAASGLTGFLNNTNVPVVTLPNGDWPNSTPEEILEDLHFFSRSIPVVTKESHQPDTLLLDTDSFALISQRSVGTAENKDTILETFLRQSPYIRNVDSWIRLNEADTPGTGPRAVAYQRDPEVLTLELPLEHEMLPPQERNLAFVVPHHARVGGVTMHYPLAVAYADGIGAP